MMKSTGVFIRKLFRLLMNINKRMIIIIATNHIGLLSGGNNVAKLDTSIDFLSSGYCSFPNNLKTIESAAICRGD